jgi:hypothetical protein
MPIFRKIIFYLFLALYLVLCPIVILYAFGYIFTPKAEEGFAKTGLVRIETIPSNAAISVSNRLFEEKTPATVRNLLPGAYDLKVMLRGYRPWVRRVEVEAGKAVNFDKIILVPQSVKTKTLVAKPFENLFPVPGTRYLLLQGGGGAGTLMVFDWGGGTSRNVLAENSPYAEATLVKIFSGKESPFVILEVKDTQGLKFLGCQLDKEKFEVKDLTRLLGGKEPKEIQWEGGHPEFLFALQGQDLSRLDLEKMTVIPDFLSKVRGFGLFKGKVYALRESSIARTGFNAKKGEETLVEKGVFLESLFRGGEQYRIDFISNRSICFLGSRGELFSNVLPYRFVDEGVRGYELDRGGRKVALWQGGRVGVLDFEKPERKKEFFERGPEIEWLFEKGTNIRQAYFVYDASHILFCDDDKIFLARIGEQYISLEKLVAVRKGSGIFYAEKTGKLYYLEPSLGEFMAADILPEGFTFAGMIDELDKESQEAGS